MDISILLQQFLGLAGVAALIAAIVNIGKQIGLIQDGQAMNAVLALNLLGMAALMLLRVFAPQVDVGQVDGVANTVAQILIIIVGLVVQIGLTKGANLALKGAPVVGFSYAQQKRNLVAQSTAVH